MLNVFTPVNAPCNGIKPCACNVSRYRPVRHTCDICGGDSPLSLTDLDSSEPNQRFLFAERRSPLTSTFRAL